MCYFTPIGFDLLIFSIVLRANSMKHHVCTFLAWAGQKFRLRGRNLSEIVFAVTPCTNVSLGLLPPKKKKKSSTALDGTF